MAGGYLWPVPGGEIEADLEIPGRIARRESAPESFLPPGGLRLITRSALHAQNTLRIG